MNINPTEPFHALAQYTKGHAFLCDKDKIDFFQKLQTLFSDYAYRDVTLLIPQELTSRCHQIDLPHLYTTLNAELLPNKNFLFAQLIATISKVARCHLPLILNQGIYPIWINKDEKEEHPRYWGWIYRSFAEEAPLLMKQLNPDGVFRFQGLSPLVLWTLQRFQEASSTVLLKRNIDIPEPCAQAFIQFLDQYEMQGIKAAFTKWMRTHAKSAPIQTQSMFYPKSPFRSLKRFAGRCVTLEKDHRYDFMEAFTRFFEHAASMDHSIPFPKGYSKRFASIDFPYLLSLAPPRSKEHQTRLFAAIQHVSKLQISSVIMFNYGLSNNPLDRQMGFASHPEVCVLMEKPFPLEEVEVMANESNHQTHIAISQFLCRHFDQPAIQSQLKEKRIFLSSVPDGLDENHLLKIFAHHLAIEPKSSLKSLMQKTFGEKPLSRQALKKLWNRVDPARQQELLDLYVEEIYHALKPGFSLDHLKQFAAHLALGQVCFIHGEAKALYHFLKRPEVIQSFLHPEVFQKMMEAIPSIYPAIIIEEWRTRESLRLTSFFTAWEEIKSPIVQSLKNHLNECCLSLQTQESMESGFISIFVKDHAFEEQLPGMRELDDLLKREKNLFQVNCPELICKTYGFLQKLLSEYLELSSHLQEYQRLLEPFSIDEEAPVNRLMNLLWKKSFHAGFDDPIPTHQQVEWLSILRTLQLDIDAELAATLLASHRGSQNPTENPQITLALVELKHLMAEKELSLQSIHILMQFRLFEKMDDASILANHGLEEQELNQLMSFLHEQETIQLTKTHQALELFRLRLIQLFEPNFLSQSLLSLSQIFTWK